MAQSKSNTVKWGIPTGGTIPAPSFGTKTTTPQSTLGQFQGGKAGLAFPAMQAVGATPQYTQPVTGTIPRTGTGNSTPAQTGQTTASSPGTPDYQGQLDSIRNQAMGIQGLLDQKNAAENTRTLTPRTEPNSFRGILDSLLGASNPTREQERTRKEMERIAKGNKAIADNAARISDEYGKEIARVGQLGAGAVAGNMSTGTSVVGSGNANLAAMSASQRMQALGTAQQAALKGTEQQLTAQEQTAQAFRPSLEASLTQQQQQISGLSSAGGLAAPVQVPYTSGLYSPFGGPTIAGGFGNWADVTTAQQAQDLIAQYPDAGVVYDPNLTPQQNAQRVQQAIAGSPAYQRNTFGAAGATSYLGGAQLGAAGAITGQVAQLQAKGEAAKANFGNLLTIMQRGQVNNLDQPALNQLQNAVRRGLASDADVVAFEAMRNSLVAAYADVLSGGNPTNEYLTIAESKLPKDVSLRTLTALEKEITSYYNNLVAGMNQAIGQYSGQTGGGGYGGGTGGSVGWGDILDN